MRLRIVMLVAIAVIVSAKEARAELTVTRGTGAEACPDTAQLRAMAASATPASAAASAHVYRVTFERGEKYRVEVIDETSHRTRRLEDTGSSCAPLAQAAAVVVATMWGSESSDRHEEEAAPPPRVVIPVIEPKVQEKDEKPGDHAEAAPAYVPLRFFVAAGGGLAEGVVRTTAPALLVDAGIERGHVSFDLGGMWIPRQELTLAPGAIDVSLVAASARACAFLWERTRLGLCGRFFAGALSASGQGFSVDTSATRPWFAAAAEIFVGGALFSPLRYRAAVAALVPFHAEVFAVSGAGVAYETPPFGALFTLSIEAATR